MSRALGTADSGDVQIAYQVIGDGPVDVVFAFDWAGNMSPRRAVRKQELAFQLDVRDGLEAIGVPTMVIQSAGNLFVMPAQGRYLAEHIPGAQYLELASGGHWPWAAPDRVSV